MISPGSIRKLALAFEGAEEQPHFEKTSFRVNKKIFVTVEASNHRACLKLSPEDQSVFSAFDREAVYPVPGKWGKLGWSYADLKKVRKDLFADALTCAYCAVAPKKLADKYRRD